MAVGFEALRVYQAARSLRKRVYRLAAQLPADEKFGLASQMRRAAVSMTNSIAEGHGSRGFKHNISYLYRVRGSICELQDDFNVCTDEAYFDPEHIESIRADSDAVLRQLNGYIRYLRSRMENDHDPTN